VHNAARDPLEAIQEITGGELADLVVEAAGEIHSINLAIDLVRPEGDILYFGFPRAQTFEYHFDKLFHKCCRTTTVVGAAVENNQTSTHLALELLASGSADAKPLITHRFGFDDVLDAYEMHRTRADGAIKIIIEMSD
jgi:threonine dehydrogenase-like Zn-dependent dehydrogenase